MGLAIVMRIKKINLPFLCAAAMSLFALIFIVTETSGIAPQLQNLYVVLKFLFAIVAMIFAAYFYLREPDDTVFALFMIMISIYCLVFMWFAPLYEVAYLEAAIASSFFRLRRKWLYPLIFGSCLVGIFITYFIQDGINWQLRPIDRSDWYSTIISFFLVAWFIQQFALVAHQREKERLSRFGVIGKEATRLTHDIKGLLSSPILMLEAINAQQKASSDRHEAQVQELSNHLKTVSEMIKSIHRLIHVEGAPERVNVNRVLLTSLAALEPRLRGIKITLPQDRTLWANPERLHSIFFNLFLNSIEAFEKNKISDPSIEIYWGGNSLIIKDNAGGTALHLLDSHSNDLGPGLGLKLVKIDIEHIGGKFQISSKDGGTQVKMLFTAKMLLSEPGQKLDEYQKLES